MKQMQTILIVVAALGLVAGEGNSEGNSEEFAERGPSFLTGDDLDNIDAGLRWAGLSRADLGYSRDYINYGLDEPVDRWRLPAAQQVLSEPLLLPELAAQWSLALSEDLGGAGKMPGWAGFHGIVASQLGSSEEEPCARVAELSTGLGVVEQSLVSEAAAGRKWSRREARSLRDRIDPRLDVAIGTLLDQASLARCRVDAALAKLSDAQQAEVIAVLDKTLWGDPNQPSGEDEEERQFQLLTGAWDSIDHAALLAAGMNWSEAILSATVDLGALPEEVWPEEPLILPTPLGEVWIGSPGSNTGSGDPVLLVDPGGDDHWRIAPHRDALPGEGFKAVRGWIDLGGSDVWRGGQGGAGGALFSVAAGIDLRGDDIYRSGRLSQGAAAFGFSSWLDQGGADRYLGTVAVQGFAAFGAAILRDAGSDGDLYQGGFLGQAAAHSGGVAVLHDGGGPDRYILGGTFEDNANRLPGQYSSCGQGFAIGMRPYSGGGVAWLLDESGHDQYIGGLWVQGSSYWHSLAALVDRGGNDLYSATQYSQGSGIHLSSAGLFDGGGDDRYLLPNLGQGSGHDLGVSWLIDASGNDHYSGNNLLQGASITNAASFFVDRSGDDTYASRTGNSRGQASPARGFGAVGVFIDGQGDDRYLDGEGGESLAGSTQLRGEHGIFVDQLPVSDDEEEAQPESEPSEAQAEAEPSEAQAEADSSDAGEVQEESDTESDTEGEDLPETASMGARELLLNNVLYIAPQEDTDAAVERLAAGGARVLRLLLPLTSDAKILRSYTIERVVQKFLDGADAAQLAEVAEAISRSSLSGETSDRDARARWHLRWLGKVAKSDPSTAGHAITAARGLISHPAWRVRKGAWTLVHSISSLEGLEWAEEDRNEWAVQATLRLDGDDLVEVRAAAARALTAVGGPGVAPSLARALTVNSFELRDAAEGALFAIAERSDGVAVARALFAIASGETAAPASGRDAALRVLGSTDHRDAWEVLQAALKSADPVTRSAAIEGSVRLKARGLRKALQELLATESAALNKASIERALSDRSIR